jgi:hypothetical protein
MELWGAKSAKTQLLIEWKRRKKKRRRFLLLSSSVKHTHTYINVWQIDEQIEMHGELDVYLGFLIMNPSYRDQLVRTYSSPTPIRDSLEVGIDQFWSIDEIGGLIRWKMCSYD